MARTVVGPARTAARLVILTLVCVAASPAAALASLNANTSLQFAPNIIQVGQSGTGTVSLLNADTAPDTASTNTVCNAGEACPTVASSETDGISVIAACRALGSGTTCPAGSADPDVFTLAPTATGAALSSCGGTIFDVARVTDTPTDFGRWRFTPRPPGSQVQLIGASATCDIAFSFTVTKAPRDANPATPELETIALTYHNQISPAVTPLLNASARSSLGLTVLRADPTLTTAASPSVQVGTPITDTATVAGRVSPVAGATVQFRLFGPDDSDCSRSPVATTSTVLTAAGTAVSDPFTPTQAGTYRWRASYSGDANNNAVSAPCNAPNEAVTVTPADAGAPPPPPPPPPAAPPRAIPTLTTTASPDVVVGGQVSDTATITGRVSPIAGSTVRFQLFGPDDATCGRAAIFSATGTVNAAGIAVSPPFTATASGVYRWIAVYSGDENNVAVAGSCNGANESVAVTPSQVTAAAFSTPPTVGETTFLEVSGVDPTAPVNGTQVSFGEGGGKSGTTACASPSLRTARKSRKPVKQRVPYAFRRAGVHKITVKVLSGTCGKPRKSKAKTLTVTVKGRKKPARRPSAGIGCKDKFLVPTALNRARVAAAILCLVNEQRHKMGRRALGRSPQLTIVASKQSADMVRRHYFAHEAPWGPPFAQRIRRDGYRGVTAAENIGYGTDYTPALAVSAWMNSPEHRSNILNVRLKFAGVGVMIGIPDTPPLPGITTTMVFGATAR